MAGKLTAKTIIDALNEASRDELLTLQKVLIIRVEYPNCKIDPQTRAVQEPQRATELFHCSFCHKSNTEVTKMVAGPNVYICSECVGVCNEIIDASDKEPASADASPNASAQRPASKRRAPRGARRAGSGDATRLG